MSRDPTSGSALLADSWGGPVAVRNVTVFGANNRIDSIALSDRVITNTIA